MTNDESINLKKFFSEIQMLKRVRNEGFRLAGIAETAPIAEHALIAAQIAFVLAKLEGADPYKVACTLIFHDNAEIRIGDQSKVNARYIKRDSIERTALAEQTDNLPGQLKDDILSLFDQIESRGTREGVIAKDADWLETAIQAKIYMEQGHRGCENWIDNVEKALETESAKQILKVIREDSDFTNTWWQGLKKMTYTKLDKR